MKKIKSFALQKEVDGDLERIRQVFGFRTSSEVVDFSLRFAVELDKRMAAVVGKHTSVEDMTEEQATSLLFGGSNMDKLTHIQGGSYFDWVEKWVEVRFDTAGFKQIARKASGKTFHEIRSRKEVKV